MNRDVNRDVNESAGCMSLLIRSYRKYIESAEMSTQSSKRGDEEDEDEGRGSRQRRVSFAILGIGAGTATARTSGS
jgi:hypothetical protein